MPRAYLLIHTADDKVASVRAALGRLHNSKALVESLFPNELVAHVEGSNAASLSDALTNQIPTIDGVTHVTVWYIVTKY